MAALDWRSGRRTLLRTGCLQAFWRRPSSRCKERTTTFRRHVVLTAIGIGTGGARMLTLPTAQAASGSLVPGSVRSGPESVLAEESSWEGVIGQASRPVGGDNT